MNYHIHTQQYHIHLYIKILSPHVKLTQLHALIFCTFILKDSLVTSKYMHTTYYVINMNDHFHTHLYCNFREKKKMSCTLYHISIK